MANVDELWGRELNVEVDSSEFTARFHVNGTTSESVAYAAIVAQSPAAFGGLYRKAIRQRELGGGRWEAEITYANINPWEAVGTTPQIPAGPAPGEPLGPGHSFTTVGGTQHITQSILTISRTLNADLPVGVLKDYRQAIGVTNDGVEGCDIVVPTLEFTRAVRRESVTTEYLKTLVALTGTINENDFYGQDPGDVLYLGCEGQYAQDSRWTLTHRFRCNKGKVNYVVARDAAGDPIITVPVVLGWDYLWVRYTEIIDGAAGRVRIPYQANVEQVYELKDFALLEVGGL